jgi:multidrug resistance efflux pump
MSIESEPALREVGSDQHWADLANASSRDALLRSWLSLQCQMIRDVSAGLLLLGLPDQGPYTPEAIWPSRQIDVTYLGSVAEHALRERRGIVTSPQSGSNAAHIAYPVEIAGQLHGVVALDIRGADPVQLQKALRHLHWGMGRLEVALTQREAQSANHVIDHLVLSLDLVAVAGEHAAFDAAARALVTELATRMQLDRVSVGFFNGQNVAVAAVSHSANFKEKAGLLRATGAAMDEARDQHATIVYPRESGDARTITRAAAELAALNGGGSVCAVPLGDAARADGVLLLESSDNQRFDGRTLELCQAIAALTGPVLALHQANSRSLLLRMKAKWLEVLELIFGSEKMVPKFIVAVVLSVLAFLTLFKGDYRVTADTVLEGKVLRASVAPFDGYIRAAPVKAGELVEKGQLMCELDDRDLRVGRQKWASRRGEVSRQLREAEAQHEWANVGILVAQREQASAELALLEDQLSRTQLVAPFDGVVVSGDLTQSLGAPVKRGDVLFEVAPLDAYRVILKVDERDIEEIAPGQQGLLTLSSMPGDELVLVVQTITPVTTAEEGSNYFRVEASLSEGHERLRPGMEGVAKVEVDQRRLIWIWTHRITDWIRLWFWSWWP